MDLSVGEIGGSARIVGESSFWRVGFERARRGEKFKKKKKNNREEEQRREEEPSYSCWMSARNALNLPSDLVWQWNVLVALGSLLQTAP